MPAGALGGWVLEGESVFGKGLECVHRHGPLSGREWKVQIVEERWLHIMTTPRHYPCPHAR